MLSKVLIANRGEIACRIIRTARRLGLRTVAVVSNADRGALHAEMADEVHPIGGSTAAESYLNASRILAEATAAAADCIHPGYGFLSENADFAEACSEAGIVFVGPSAEAMRQLGRKDAAKALAERIGVPVVPGYFGKATDRKRLEKEAARIGFPLMVKAVAGGGGRGMRRVLEAGALGEALEGASREAEASFGDPRVMLERLIDKPRHVEVQVFGDGRGGAVHLFERDCTLQRRHQKVVEEAPAPGMSEGLRAKLTGHAVALAKAARYANAGTVEFLVEGGSLAPDAPHYFIEMNTRLQVEHPVTEAVTGLDLVEWQFRIAAGEGLPLGQDAIGCSGHAVEVRLYAEDPAAGFLPSTGPILAYAVDAAPGLRVDTGVRSGGVVTPYYDSMIAKLIAHAPDRDGALDRLGSALAGTLVAGPRTNGAFLAALLAQSDVRAGRLDTGLIDRELERLVTHRPGPVALEQGVAALLAGRSQDIARRRALFSNETDSPWDRLTGFQLGGPRRLTMPFLVDGKEQPFEITWGDGSALEIRAIAQRQAQPAAAPGNQIHAVRDGERVLVVDALVQAELRWPQHGAGEDDGMDGEAVIRAPITGRVAKVLVSLGTAVEKGARIAVIEAMKMEHVLIARRSGVVAEIATAEGAQVAEGTVIARIGEPT